MEITNSQRLELIGGIGAALLSLISPTSLNLARFMFSDLNAKEKLLGLLSLFLTYVGPALLLGLGSYVHAVRRKNGGLIMIFVGGLILVIGIPVAILGGAVYFYGIWGGLLGLTPGAMAILTMIASLVPGRATAKA